MHTLTVTIGRNYGTTPTHLPLPTTMSISTWEQFKGDVEEDVTREIRDGQPEMMVTEWHYGKGMWQGVEEESAKLTVMTSEPIDAEHLAYIKGYLRSLAQQYTQDAIALTIGESELMTPRDAYQMSDAEITARAAWERGTD